MNSFQNTGDMFLKSCRSNKSARSHGRKRRANSDSELTFMDTHDGKSLFGQQLFTMHNDDIDIDIMADSHSDSNVLSGNTAIDPSQMFIMLTNTQNTFSYSPPHTVLNSSDVDTNVTHACNVTSTVLDQTTPDPSLFTAQLYLVDTSIPGVVAEGSSSHLIEEQVNGLFGIQTAGSSHLSTTEFGHIPAKFLKKKLPSQLVRKAVASQVDTTDGRDQVNQSWVTHKEEKQDLKKTGCTWKNGLWSNDEEELLRNNIDDYCKANNIPDPTIMIFSTPREERKAFYRSICELPAGLNRPLFAVYRKVLRMYDQKNYVGKYSPDELDKLEKLCRLYKNDWVLIGNVLGRSAASVKDRARLLNCPNKRGKWEAWELEMLSSLVHQMTNTKKGDSVTTGINWTEISDQMTTRTDKQCRTKWLHFLNWKESGGKKWSKADEKELVNRILSADLTEESKINWDEICSGWTSVRSPQWLRQKWWKIKKTVPDFKVCEFPELMSFLKTIYIDVETQPVENDENTDGIQPTQQLVVNETDHVVESNEPLVADRNEFNPLQVSLPEGLINQNLDSGVTNQLNGGENNQFGIPTLSLQIQLQSNVTISTSAQLHDASTSTENDNYPTNPPPSDVHVLYPT